MIALVPSRALIPRHAGIVTAAAARIFPTTDTPGATEAGVVTYVERTLSEAFPRLIPLYRAGCRALDRHAKAAHGAGFVELTDAQKDAVVTDFEAGRVPGFRRAGEFFALLRKHTMEGVLGEPSYGGNQGLVGWRVVGFPGHQYGYADPYINRKIDLEPVAVDRPYDSEEAWRGQQV